MRGAGAIPSSDRLHTLNMHYPCPRRRSDLIFDVFVAIMVPTCLDDMNPLELSSVAPRELGTFPVALENHHTIRLSALEKTRLLYEWLFDLFP